MIRELKGEWRACNNKHQTILVQIGETFYELRDKFIISDVKDLKNMLENEKYCFKVLKEED